MLLAITEHVTILILWSILSAIVAGFLFSAVFSLQGEKSKYCERFRANILPAIGFSLPVVLVGYVAGYLTGLSRASAVAGVVPAVLALIGGIHVYVYGAQAQNRGLIGYSVFVFTAFFLLGTNFGAMERELGREQRLILLSDQEKKIRTYRKNRDLPPDIPDWMTTGEPK